MKKAKGHAFLFYLLSKQKIHISNKINIYINTDTYLYINKFTRQTRESKKENNSIVWHIYIYIN